MVRVKRGATTRRRHKAILKRAEGYEGPRSKRFKQANEAVMKAGQHAYNDRRNRKRQMRRLWIQRINAGARQHGLPYNQFINGLSKSGVEVNRKMLADLAIKDPNTFAEYVAVAKSSL